MKKTFIFLFAIVSFFSAQAQDIVLYSKAGEAKAYISEDDLTIYMWNGDPVAYLHNSGGGAWSIYGFNGSHIGWYADGYIYDNEGSICGAERQTCPSFTTMPGLTSMKSMKPMKSMREMRPMKPQFSNTWGRTSLVIVLRSGE